MMLRFASALIPLLGWVLVFPMVAEAGTLRAFARAIAAPSAHFRLDETAFYRFSLTRWLDMESGGRIGQTYGLLSYYAYKADFISAPILERFTVTARLSNESDLPPTNRHLTNWMVWAEGTQQIAERWELAGAIGIYDHIQASNSDALPVFSGGKPSAGALFRLAARYHWHTHRFGLRWSNIGGLNVYAGAPFFQIDYARDFGPWTLSGYFRWRYNGSDPSALNAIYLAIGPTFKI